MNKPNLLHRYQNNNYLVSIYDDGSKVREFTDLPNPLYPEAADIKITNFCDLNCNFCFESSTTAGKHGDLKVAFEFLSSLPAGAELALGGGNPLSHPDLKDFLYNLKSKNIIANITINQLHVLPYQQQLRNLLSEKLIYGIGVSYNRTRLEEVKWLLQESDDVIFHMITGIHTIDDMLKLYALAQELNKPLKVLLLGYKQYGLGQDLYDKKSSLIDTKIKQWYQQLPQFFSKDNIILSFDNLAINQLNVKRFFKDKDWSKFYMGDDGTFTFFVDFVKQVFTKSSISTERFSIKDHDICSAFQKIRNT